MRFWVINHWRDAPYYFQWFNYHMDSSGTYQLEIAGLLVGVQLNLKLRDFVKCIKKEFFMYRAKYTEAVAMQNKKNFKDFHIKVYGFCECK